MARNPLAEGKYVSMLVAVDTSGANPAATTISGVRQIKRVVGTQMWNGTPGDPTHEVLVSSGTDMVGNIVYLYSIQINGTPAAVTDNFWITVEVA